ncbi:hypothetical protein [Nonomuraea sp. B19D2]|uniref:hypothetical protein n=1 Tax=Nonomuraea sp. B19D2 TaxID=3159561 RepID=UPI0032D9E44C
MQNQITPSGGAHGHSYQAQAAPPLGRRLFLSHWTFLLGELALYSFALLVLTGTFRTLFYKPQPGLAFASTVEISLDVRGGLLMRQLHHWSATVFVLAIVAGLPVPAFLVARAVCRRRAG